MSRHDLNEHTYLETGGEKHRKTCDCKYCHQEIKRSGLRITTGQFQGIKYHVRCYIKFCNETVERLKKEKNYLVNKYGQDLVKDEI